MKIECFFYSDNGDGVLLLHGPQGSGKTTLLCKLGHQLEAEAEVSHTCTRFGVIKNNIIRLQNKPTSHSQYSD